MERAALSGAALFIKKTAQKHGWASVLVSIAGLSESGANAEHIGKSCSRLELVVRECGLMLQGMVSVFLIDCEAFLRICRIRSDFPGKIGEENQEPVQGFMAFFLSKLHSGRNIRDLHDRWDRESVHGVSGFPSPYIYIA